tara:strand:- start:13234 stop:14085 length:852 start_codon:yes stop_codon:yes gene_type:complete
VSNVVKYSKSVTLAALLAFGAVNQAGAATITYGGQAATDGNNLSVSAGLTSNFISSTNIISDVSLGYFVETFDASTALDPSAGGNTSYNVGGTSSAGCQVNSPLAITPSSVGVVKVRNDSVDNVAAAPANDNTCYAYTTPANEGSNSDVEIDYTSFLSSLNNTALEDSYINYLGFYWGSVDEYNSFEFYNGTTKVAEITGPQLLAQLGGSPGNQVADSSNVYVNIAFDASEAFDSFKVITSGIAGEFDNIVIGLDKRPVPAPASLAFLGLGLLGLGLGRRFKK